MSIYDLHEYMEYVTTEARKAAKEQVPLEIPCLQRKGNSLLSELYGLNVVLLPDPQSWPNVSFARYWGVPYVWRNDNVVWPEKIP